MENSLLKILIVDDSPARSSKVKGLLDTLEPAVTNWRIS